MKKFISLSLVWAVVLTFILSGCQKTEVMEPVDETESIDQMGLKIGDVVPGNYIVVLQDNENIQALQAASNDLTLLREAVLELAQPALQRHSIDPAGITMVYGKVLTGFAIEMTAEQARVLAGDRDVKYVEPDRLLGLIPVPDLKKKPPPPPPPGQVTPWGIARVGGVQTFSGNGKAWVIDTGVDLDHPDLNVNVTESISFVPSDLSPDDKNGHGSHVAGTIAAINNSFGVIGVAPGATVVSVRVLNRQGSGFYSWIIAGVDYVGVNADPDDVANMSLGGGYYQTLNEAVLTASANCKFSLAAGNEADDAGNYSPGSTEGPNVYTVSAMQEGNIWAWFSNFSGTGGPVDYCAPGVSVYSCYKGGGYATMSGTSMAAPHVAGILLLGNVGSDGTVIGDPETPADPIAHH